MKRLALSWHPTWVRILVFIAAQLLLLLPGMALAHRGHAEHGIAAPEQGNHFPAAQVASPCAPGPDHACGCGNLEALSRATDAIASVRLSGWDAAECPVSAAAEASNDDPGPRFLAHSPVRPRAPPHLA